MGIALKVNAFGGMLPAIDDRLLPDHAAALSQNAYLVTGKLQGSYALKTLRALSQPAALKAFRIPNNFADAQHLTDAVWMEFLNQDTDVLRGPVVGDTFQRYYWASSSNQPMYNTLARIKSATNALILGVPNPAVAPGVTPTGGSSSTVEARSYVYTWVTAYGEEGPPSPPTVVTGKIDATWAITMSPAAANDTNGVNRNITNTNIYRTITDANGVATYFFVAQVPVATLSYNDTVPDTTVAGNNQLLSTTWSAPPTDLQGWIAMPNGMIAGWRANEVWFCEPYRPHAWPAQYAVACDFPIVGLGVIGQTLVICTESTPYWGYGVNPSSFAMSKIQTVEPCLSRGSILSAPEGVYYASPNGVVLVNQGTVVNVTRQYLTKDKWLSLTSVPTLRAARLGTTYYAWGSGRTGVFDINSFDNNAFDQQDLSGTLTGVLIDPTDTRVAVTQLQTSAPNNTFNTMNDPWTGEVFLIRNGHVMWLDISDTDPSHEPYIWRSKVFQTPNRRNLGAIKIYFEVTDKLPTLNPTPNANLVQTFDPTQQWGLVRVYADGVLVWTRELRTSGELMRLPSGFKSDFYQIEINAIVSVYNIQVAESAKELAKV